MAVRPSFFAELRRRNVLRAAALYVAAVWALAQGIAQLSGPLGLANWVTVWFLVACAIGFPLWIAFAWFYEFTPQGIRRESEVAPSESITHSTARKLDFAIIGVLALAVILLASGYFVGRNTDESFAGAVAANASAGQPSFAPPPNTLVVLPFRNLSKDPQQQYFSDGITEELTNALGRNTALRVIAWDTAAHYRDTTESATAIGKALDVANVLNGKILREGDVVRVIVELVNARTGYQVWAEHYDDSLANVFAVQDQITQSIAGALKLKFASLGTAPTVNPKAYDLVLKARALLRTAQTASPILKARALFEQAIVIAPDYADAHAGLAGTWLDLTQYSTLSLSEALPRMREEANRALALNPRNVDALLALGNADASEGKTAAARSTFERALAIDPSNAFAHVDYGNLLPLAQSLAQEQEAVQLDPDNATAQNDLAATELDLGDYAQALAPAQAMLKLAPHSADNALVLAETYTLLKRGEDAVMAFDSVQPDTPIAKALVAAGRLTYQSAVEPKLHPQALAAVDALRKRPDLDPGSVSDVIQLYLALGADTTALKLLPQNCAAQPVGCSDLSVNPLFLPLRGDPRFEALVKQYDTVSKPAPAATAPAAAATSQ